MSAAPAGEGCGRDVGAHEGADDDSVDRSALEGLRDARGLAIPELGEIRARCRGIELARDIRGRLAMADEEEVHSPQA